MPAPTKIISRRQIIGQNKAKAWLYMLDNGQELTMHHLPEAFGLDVAPQTLHNRMAKLDYRDPGILRPKQLGQGKRGKAKTMSTAKAKELLAKFGREHKIAIETTFIEIEGYEPVLVDEVAYAAVSI